VEEESFEEDHNEVEEASVLHQLQYKLELNAALVVDLEEALEMTPEVVLCISPKNYHSLLLLKLM